MANDRDIASKPASERPPVSIRSKITSISSEKFREVPVEGFNLSVEFDRVTQNGAFVEIWFNYRVEYQPELGYVAMKGVMLFDVGEEAAFRLTGYYERHKAFEQPWLDMMIGNINYKCSMDSVIAARLLDLPSPVMPPRISFANSAAAPPPEQSEPQKKSRLTVHPSAPPNPPAASPASKFAQSNPFSTPKPPFKK